MDYVITQMLGLADKEFKAFITVIKDVKENILLMHGKILWFKRNRNYKNTNQMEILKLKNIVSKLKFKNFDWMYLTTQWRWQSKESGPS